MLINISGSNGYFVVYQLYWHAIKQQLFAAEKENYSIPFRYITLQDVVAYFDALKPQNSQEIVLELIPGYRVPIGILDGQTGQLDTDLFDSAFGSDVTRQILEFVKNLKSDPSLEKLDYHILLEKAQNQASNINQLFNSGDSQEQKIKALAAELIKLENICATFNLKMFLPSDNVINRLDLNWGIYQDNAPASSNNSNKAVAIYSRNWMAHRFSDYEFYLARIVNSLEEILGSTANHLTVDFKLLDDYLNKITLQYIDFAYTRLMEVSLVRANFAKLISDADVKTCCNELQNGLADVQKKILDKFSIIDLRAPTSNTLVACSERLELLFSKLSQPLPEKEQRFLLNKLQKIVKPDSALEQVKRRLQLLLPENSGRREHDLWEHRKPYLLAEVRGIAEQGAAIYCLQEMTLLMLAELKKNCPELECYAISNQTGEDLNVVIEKDTSDLLERGDVYGNSNPILWDRKRFSAVIPGKVRWLSATPEHASPTRTGDHNFTTLMMVVLRDQWSGVIHCIYNTHFTVFQENHAFSINILSEMIQRDLQDLEQRFAGIPIIAHLAGDGNTFMGSTGAMIYAKLHEKFSLIDGRDSVQRYSFPRAIKNASFMGMPFDAMKTKAERGFLLPDNLDFNILTFTRPLPLMPRVLNGAVFMKYSGAINYAEQRLYRPDEEQQALLAIERGDIAADHVGLCLKIIDPLKFTLSFFNVYTQRQLQQRYPEFYRYLHTLGEAASLYIGERAATWLINDVVVDKTVDELLELVRDLDVAMYEHLPKEWHNPGVANFCAFRIVADALAKHRDSLANDVKEFLKAINRISQQAIKILREQGNKAVIKPLANQLLEYAAGFERKDFLAQRFNKIKQALFSLPRSGQLSYREEDGRFLVMIDPRYIENAYQVEQRMSPAASPELEGHAHITVNPGMAKDKSQAWFIRLQAIYGEAEPRFGKQLTGIRYLNKTIDFEVIGAYEGMPKTRSRMKNTLQLLIKCEELAQLAEQGLACPNKSYNFHITYAEELRSPYERLENIGAIFDALDSDGLTGQLKQVLLLHTTSHQQAILSTLRASTALDASVNLEATKDAQQLVPVHSKEALPMTGAWATRTEYDANTGEPIFRYNILSKFGEVIGYAKFYGQPLLCQSKEGDRHNIIETGGILSNFKITPEMNITEVCRVLPPTLFEKVIINAIPSGIYGTIGGASQVIGITLRARGLTPLRSSLYSNLCYFASIFLLEFYLYQQQIEFEESLSRYMNASYQAAMKTGNLFLWSIALLIIRRLFEATGEQLHKQQRPWGGYLATQASRLAQFGMSLFNVKRFGTVESLTSFVTGSVVTTGISYLGEKIIGQASKLKKT